MPSQKAAPPNEPQHRAGDLFLQGRVVEASRLLSDAIVQDESADLWNDWAVVQLSLAERALRRALQFEPSHADAATNLGVLLFSSGKRAEAAVVLKQALGSATGPARAQIQTLLSLCVPPSVSAAAPRAAERDALICQIHHVLDEYFRKGSRASDVVTPAGFEPIVDAQPGWMETILGNGSIHDQDYLVFGLFQDPETTILDIGAHFGYSAASIWSSGAASRVISFEVNPAYEPCLQRIAQLRPGRYEYCLAGLSDSPGSLEFAMPVMNGYGIGALATACASPNIDCLAKNLADHFEKCFSAQPLASFRIHVFQAPVARLDDLLAACRFSVPIHKVVAIKIDTEGLEAQVLAGTRDLLAAQKPIILAEGGHSNPLVSRQLLQLGYVYAQRAASQLQIVSAPTTAINGFFLHPAHEDEYRHIGLLQP
jgi:FkbM family methyltransferase